jgi:hypothetical protein
MWLKDVYLTDHHARIIGYSVKPVHRRRSHFPHPLARGHFSDMPRARVPFRKKINRRPI